MESVEFFSIQFEPNNLMLVKIPDELNHNDIRMFKKLQQMMTSQKISSLSNEATIIYFKTFYGDFDKQYLATSSWNLITIETLI